MSTNGSMSPWVGPITINVPCSPTSIPFVDGFETAPAYSGNNANPNLPSCWAYDGTGGTSYSMSYGYAFYAYSGSYSLYNYMYLGGNDTNVVSTPMLENLDQGGHMVTFYAKTNSSSYPGKFNVVMTDANGNYETARIIKAIDLQGSTTHQEYQVYLDSNAVQAGDKRVGFMMYSKAASYDYVFLDSVTVDVMPSCISYDHVTSNITSSSADMSWNYTGANCFNIEYGPAGFIQGTGTGALAGTLDTNVTGPYSVSGLNPNTSYDYYLENCCNPGVWEGPFTFNTECTGPLATGTYSVGATGDFATLDSVLSTLNVCGISGAVTFELQSGSFYASSPVGAINGSSATNTVTFKGSATTNDTINGGIVLEGASYVNLEDLYIRTTSGHTIRLNGTDHINITGNVIEAPQTNSSQSNPIVASASSTSYSSFTGGEEFITISNNTITGGYFSMTFYGNSGTPGAHHDIEVSNNDISGSYYYGLYFYYGLNIEITDNTIGGFTNTFNYAAYTYQVDGCKITGNHVESYYSIYAYYVNTTTAAAFDSEISNNMMSGGYYGLRVYYCNNLDVYHNTAVGSYAGLYDYYNGATVDIRNNIFQGGTYALYDYNSSAVQDYNLYYSTGTSLAYIYNGSFSYPTDLATLIAADTTNNLSSVVGDPIFASASDLHVYGPLANDVGDNTTGITVDIDGDTRPMSGSTVVDMGADEFDVAQDDAALTALLSPTPGICGGDSLMVSVEIGNFGQTTITSMTVSADVLGQTLTVSPTTLSIPFGGKDTIMLGYVSNYVGGPMSVVAYTTLSNDARPGNDTLSTSIDISDAQQVVPVAQDFACAGETVSLSIAHPTTGSFLWTNILGDTVGYVDADSTLSLVLTQDTTLTLSAESTGSEIQNTFGIGTSGGNYNFFGTTGVKFTATQQFMLDSVTVYPNAAGSTTINITDQVTGSVVWTGSVATTATGNTAEEVYIGALIAPGSYNMYGASSTTGGLYREYGVTGYPFTNPTGEVSVDQGSLNNYHYFFYNWKVTVGGCERADSTITIQVHPDPVASITVDSANATITSTDWSASWDASGTTDADSVYVEFSNGTTSNATSGTVTFTANMAGETVTVIAFGPCTSDTATFTFDVNQISVDEDFMNGSLSIYPNPTRGLFNVEFATEQAKDVEITIVNMLGQVVSTDVVEVNGVYNNQFDLSNESAGVYFITFTTDEGVLTQRITVE